MDIARSLSSLLLIHTDISCSCKAGWRRLVLCFSVSSDDMAAYVAPAVYEEIMF